VGQIEQHRRTGIPAICLNAFNLVSAIDRKEIRSIRDVYRALDFFDPGDTVELEVMRGGEQQRMEATLGGRAFRGGMPPSYAPFAPPNMPRYPGFRMSPPEAWPERMEELRDSMRMPPYPWQPGPGAEGTGQRMPF